MPIITPTFRVSYPNVFKPVLNDLNPAAPKYEYTLEAIFEPDADLAELKEMVREVIAKRWPKGAPENLRKPFRKGDEKNSPEYHGKIWVRLKSSNKPQVIDRDGKTHLEHDDHLTGGFYGGCHARASVNVFAYPKEGVKGISPGVSIGLMNLQKVGDGEPFSSWRTRAEDDFSPVGTAAEADNDDLFE